MVEQMMPIELSENAAARVHELIAEEENEMYLRIYITGGGCSGFQYGFTFDEKKQADDFQVERDGVTLVVDPMSLQYLVGSIVDYEDSLQGSRFYVKNPNADSTCGCGSSFSV